jgi:putative transposase
VGAILEEFRISERRGCQLLGLGRSSCRYRLRRRDAVEIRRRLRELALQRPCWGYRMLGDVLRGEGILVNHKRVYRLYRAEELRLPRKRGRKAPRPRQPKLEPPSRANQRWAMDFVSDTLAGGRRFRNLTIVDEKTRESPGICVDTSIGGKRVARFLDERGAERGLPEVIVVDNGPEFTSRAMHEWARKNGVRLHFIDPGKPTQNAFGESFNGTFRVECLNANWFLDLADARNTIEEWRRDYNDVRPHGSIGRQPPARYAKYLEEHPTTVETAEISPRFPLSPQPDDDGVTLT